MLRQQARSERAPTSRHEFEMSSHGVNRAQVSHVTRRRMPILHTNGGDRNVPIGLKRSSARKSGDRSVGTIRTSGRCAPQRDCAASAESATASPFTGDASAFSLLAALTMRSTRPAGSTIRRGGESLAKRARLFEQRLRLARGCKQLLGGQALTLWPAGHILAEPVDQVFELADVHCPPNPASPRLS